MQGGIGFDTTSQRTSPAPSLPKSQGLVLHTTWTKTFSIDTTREDWGCTTLRASAPEKLAAAGLKYTLPIPARQEQGPKALRAVSARTLQSSKE
ncbi:hypothetical protein CF326_g8411 [Tilletia indica]|nr:hypothetical protein CF326_g8411 [Tilletia indica]